MYKICKLGSCMKPGACAQYSVFGHKQPPPPPTFSSMLPSPSLLRSLNIDVWRYQLHGSVGSLYFCTTNTLSGPEGDGRERGRCMSSLLLLLYHRVWALQPVPYHTPPSNLGLSVSRSHCFLSVFHVVVVVHTFSAPGWQHDKGLVQHSHKVSVLKCPGLAGSGDLWINSRNVREYDFGTSLPSKLGQAIRDTVTQDGISSGEVGQGWLWTACEYRIWKSGWEDLTWHSFCF